MEKSKLLQVIAAIMITSMAVSMLSFSTTTVSAAHTQGTPTIDNTKVKGSTSRVFTITVTNNGPDAVDNVRIIVPSEFTNIASVLKIFTDNQVALGGSLATPENIVTLKAGTIISLSFATLSVGADNVVIIPSGTKIRWTRPTTGDNFDGYVPTENLRVKLMRKFFFTVLDNADNVALTADKRMDEGSAPGLNQGTARLLADTQVVRLGTPGTAEENVVRLPENTTLALVYAANATMVKDNLFTLVKENFVPLNADNLINPPTDNCGENFLAAEARTIAGLGSVLVNDNVMIWDTAIAENIVLPVGTKLTLENNATVYVFENTHVVRLASENVTMAPATATAAENSPKNWTQSMAAASTLPAGTYVEWTGIGDNQIASGSSLAIPISFTVPAAADNYTIYVKTTDINGVSPPAKEIILTVDNSGPTVQISASPSWVKDNAQVTITVTATEPLAKLDNVMVAEKNALENTQITMTPNADKTIWTGTYTTGDNNLRDNLATIYVVGAQLEDLVGNAGTDTTGTFTVDRMAPPEPRLDNTFISGLPADELPKTGIQTKKTTWTLENTAYDNLAGTLVLQAGMTVKVRVGTTVYDITTPASGYWAKQITLSEGTQELGIQFVDKAGNASTENAENVTLDSTKPSVTMISPAAGAIINDNKPLISLTISDATLGIENMPFAGATVDNSGYSVWLRRNGDNAVLATLTPKNPTTIPRYFNSLTFENQWQLDNALPDNAYNILVVAGDNLQNENVYFSFTIDTTKPVWTQAQLLAAVTVKDPTTLNVLGTTTKKTSWLISGGARKAGSTIKVYVGAAAATATLKDTVTASTTLNNNTGLYDYSLTIALSEGANQSVFIEEIDTASNTSGLVLLGTYTVDATPPVIALSAPAVDTTTDAAQITVSGTITDAIVTDYQTLAVTIDCTGATVAKRVYLNANGSFETTVPLIEGVNVINVIAADGAVTATSGNQAITTRTVTRTVTPLTTYAIILVVVALILAAIAIFRKEMK